MYWIIKLKEIMTTTNVNGKFRFPWIMTMMLLLSAAMLSACEKTAGGDEDEDEPTGKIDTKIVGIWGSGFSASDWNNAVTGAYDYTSGSINGIEFKSDGTFYSIYVSSGKIGSVSVVTVRMHYGKYRVESNNIYLTNRMSKRETYNNRQINPAETDEDFKPYDDQILNYVINGNTLDLSNPDGTLVSVDMVHTGTLSRVQS
jgi:hypothetical protein